MQKQEKREKLLSQRLLPSSYPRYPCLRRTSRSHRSNLYQWKKVRRPKMKHKKFQLFKTFQHESHAQKTITTNHRWRSERSCSVIVSSRHFSCWHPIPPEVEFPIESAPCLIGSSNVFKRLVANDVDYWTHNCSSIQDNSG